MFSQLHTGKHSRNYYIDSTALPVCHLKRSKRNKVFGNIAVFGLKLHLVVNNQGELIAFKLMRGNRNDANAKESMLKWLKGLLFGEKGYIGKELCARLLERGLKLITRTRKNMKPIDYSLQWKNNYWISEELLKPLLLILNITIILGIHDIVQF